MTRSIRSYPEWQRREVIRRRLRDKTGGLGYQAALDAMAKLHIMEIPEDAHETTELESDVESIPE